MDVRVNYTVHITNQTGEQVRSLLIELDHFIPEVLQAIEDLHYFISRLPKTSHLSAPTLFVLAVMSKFPEYRSVALSTVPKILQTFEQLALFVKFSEAISPHTVDDLFQQMIHLWYESQHVSHLAQMVARVEHEVHGHSHKTILTMANIFTSDDPLRGTIYEFIHNGIEATLEKYGDIEAVSEYVEYLFDFCRLEGLALRDTLPLISKHAFYPDQIPSNHLSQMCVWTRILDFISIHELNQWVRYLAKRHFFRNDAFIARLAAYLGDPESISKSYIHPNHTLITECDLLEISTRQEIATALHSQKHTTFSHIERMKIDITVIINCHVLDEKTCVTRKTLKGSEAAAMVAFSLKKVAMNINIFTLHGFKKHDLNCDDYSELLDKIEKNGDRKSSTKAIKNALKDDSSELFVIVGHKIDHSDYMDVIGQRSSSNPAKFVFCHLSDFGDDVDVQNHEHVLVVDDFNEATCEVITAFGVCG